MQKLHHLNFEGNSMFERVFVVHWGLTIIGFFDEVVIMSSQFTWHYW